MRQFHLLMAERTHTVLVSLDEDLGPPSFLLDAISDLRIILGAYDSSLAPLTQNDEELSAILDSALTPYLRQCEQLSSSLPRLSRCVMLFNCYDIARVRQSCRSLTDF
jgi:conserved oligomeric Golgi complex subunit 6